MKLINFKLKDIFENRKLNRIKEMIEPYIRVNKKSDEIKNELIEVFKSDIPEIKLLRLIHDNKYKAIKKISLNLELI